MLADVGRLVCFRWVSQLLPIERTAMTCTPFAKEQVLFREGDPANSVFRVLSGSVDIFRELDGEAILLGTVGAGQFIGEMGVVENRPRSATARAASEVEVESTTGGNPSCRDWAAYPLRQPVLHTWLSRDRKGNRIMTDNPVELD